MNMHTTILFLDDELNEMDRATLNGMSIKETVDLINKTSEFRIGDDNNLHGKSGWLAIDFRNNTVELMMKTL
jgi:hypothetical protein